MATDNICKFETAAGIVYLDKDIRRTVNGDLLPKFVVTWEFESEPMEFKRYKTMGMARHRYQDICAILMARTEVMEV